MNDITKRLDTLAPTLLQIGILLAVAMTTVHVTKFLIDHDGLWGIVGGAAMPAATVGASAIAFDGRRSNRGRAWVAVGFFATCSAIMQTAYFIGESPTINQWLIATAIARGVVWPVGEVLLGGVLAFIQEGHGESLLSKLQESIDQLTKQLSDARATIDQLTTEAKAAAETAAIATKRVAELEHENRHLRQMAEAPKSTANTTASNPPELTANLTAKQMDNIRQILSVISGGSFATDAELAAAAGWSETSARRYRAMAEGAGIIYKNGDGRYHQGREL